MTRHRALAIGVVIVAGGCLETITRPVHVGPPIAQLRIVGPDSAVLAGHSLALQVKAWDAAGVEVSSGSLLWESEDSVALPVNATGVVTAPVTDSTAEVGVFVTAVGAGVADTIRIHVAIPGEVKWHLPLAYLPLSGGPAEGLDGTIYVIGGMQFGPRNATLYAVSPGGQVKWSAPVSNVWAANYPIVGVDGTVFVVGQYVYAFAPDGSPRWSMTARPAENPPNIADFHSGAVDAAGTLYAAMGYDLFALRGATGDTLWQGPRALDGGWLLPPTISVDGRTTYVKNTSDPLFAFRSATGTLAWALPDTSTTLSYGVGPALSGDRFVIPLASRLQEADTNGSAIAESPNISLGVSEPAIAGDGTRYVQTSNSAGLQAFGPGAVKLWEVNRRDYRARWTWYGGPALAEGGTLYLAGRYGFYAMQIGTGGATVRWQYPSNAGNGDTLVFVGAPLIGRDGTVYTFSSCDFGRESLPCADELYAFWEDKLPDPASPWPMWRHDARRSGQADR